MNQRIELLCLAANPGDATAAHRIVQPISALKKHWPELTTNSWFLANGLNLTGNTISTIDALFMQRPCEDSHLQIMMLAKEAGVPILVDYDDYIFDIPESNLARDTFEVHGWLPKIAECLRLADIVMVSTPALRDAFAKYTGLSKDKFRVVPNAWDDVFVNPKSMLDRRSIPKRPQKIIAFRGSNTHPGDMEVIGSGFQELAARHPDWLWFFFGYIPPKAKKIPEPQRRHVPWIPHIYQYLKNLRAVAPDLMFFPLEECTFNHSKANMCLMEAAWAGSPLVCPRWPEWEVPGAVNYEPGRVIEKLDEAMSGKIDLPSAAAASWKWTQENRLLSKTNDLRKKIILELVEMRK